MGGGGEREGGRGRASRWGSARRGKFSALRIGYQTRP
jgi:hypothetical protein